jgi:hypothetical protein
MYVLERKGICARKPTSLAPTGSTPSERCTAGLGRSAARSVREFGSVLRGAARSYPCFVHLVERSRNVTAVESRPSCPARSELRRARACWTFDGR